MAFTLITPKECYQKTGVLQALPIGLFLGGFLVDRVCEPYMSNSGYAISFLFGEGKGSGAAMVLFILGVAGTVMCLVFGRILKKYSYSG